MCQFQKLYFDNNGYVVRCKDCNTYQIAYQGALLNFSPAELDEFKSEIRKKLDHTHPGHPAKTKCIILNLQSESMKLILTLEETNILWDILEEADTEFKTTTLIEMFCQ